MADAKTPRTRGQAKLDAAGFILVWNKAEFIIADKATRAGAGGRVSWRAGALGGAMPAALSGAR